MKNKTIWLIGTGLMGLEYAKILKNLAIPYIAIGRGKENCNSFTSETGVKTKEGGLSRYLQSNPELPWGAINAVGIESLSETSILLMDYGVKNVLLEKPGIAYLSELDALTRSATINQSNVLLAYNRRFYASVLKAKERIQADGGAMSFHFEFTEWSHLIGLAHKHKAEFHTWFLGNSSHVIDTAFFLGGFPKEMCSYHTGSLLWHPSGSIYSGAGISETDALFSYIANWEAPGRWSVEIMTKKHRYILKPMEKLQVMNIGSVSMEYDEEIDYSLDEDFKPGLYLQTQSFLDEDYSNFITLEQQKDAIEKYYRKMSNYKI